MALSDAITTIPEALASAAHVHAGRPAYASDAGSLTWAELQRRSLDFGAGLRVLGLQRGDRVAICAENSLDWVTAAFGAMAAGAVIVPIYHELKATEIATQLARPACRFAVVSPETLMRMPEHSPGLERVILIGSADEAGSSAMPFGAVLAAATSEARAALRERAPSASDLAAIIFTSGTTGGAKGVMLSHHNFVSNAKSLMEALSFSDQDSVLLVLPLHHAMPFLATVVLPPFVGARIFIENDVRRVRDRLPEVKPTVFFGVPALYEIMYRNVLARAESEGRLATLQAFQKRLGAVKRMTGVNLAPLAFRPIHKALGGRLRFLVSGGAALKPATAAGFFSLGLPLLQGWGMTEASPVVAVQRFSANRFRFSRYYENHAGSVGRPLPGVEVRLIDVPEKEIMVSSGEGEVVVRGDNVFRGYWQAEEETSAAMLDGWLRTGDLARIDPAGNIYLTGRSKYIIVLDSGEKVHPDELEEKLSESPLVEDVCIVGRGGRDKVQVAAIVYPNVEATAALLVGRGSLTEDAVRRAVAAEIDRLGRELAPYKRVSQVLLADAPLPKTPLLKVIRGELPDTYDFSVARWLDGATP